eukprot:2039411-Pleurochrysis_carterae.AAC.1
MAKITHRALPPFTVRALGDMPPSARSDKRHSYGRPVRCGHKKREAQASSAWSGNVRASRSAARTDEERG